MKTMQEYLSLYSLSHQNSINKIIHKFCVPLILFTVLGMLESIKVSVAACLVIIFFYLLTETSKKLLFIIISKLVFFEFFLLKFPDVFNFLNCFLLFFVSWILQFVGHKIEGRSPSFLDDLLFLLVGPVWVWFDFLDLND